ncbi:60S ribosomal protein L10 [Melia azedarach]|uniref:60S ribosomal protein L10 n=1 Tax=Melia azedarach TaxID=155640 RepID=A0ACC1Y9F2_MELAZ|nr:60S ribosomal protein L10 [Melia azedarach]
MGRSSMLSTDKNKPYQSQDTAEEFPILKSGYTNGNHHPQEAIRRAKFKYPGQQKIIVSRKWGFTKFGRADYGKWMQEDRIVPDSVNARLLGCHGPLADREPEEAFL